MHGLVASARASQLLAKGLVQQRLLQRLQRGVLPLVEAGAALGFGYVHELGIGFRGAAGAAISPGSFAGLHSAIVMRRRCVSARVPALYPWLLADT